MEDKAIRRWSRVLDAGAFWSAKCQEWYTLIFIRSPYIYSSMIAELDVEKRAPITVKYEIPYFTVSGIQVRYLKIVEKSGYQALPWVRYITQNGDDYRYVHPSLLQIFVHWLM